MVKQIALVLALNNNLQRSMLRGMQRYIVGRPWVYHTAMPQMAFMATLTEWQPDAVIGRFNQPELVQAIQRLNVPVVHLARESLEYTSTAVLPDDEAIGRFAAQHLRGLGFEHFGFFGPVGTALRLARERGFRGELAQSDHECHSYVLPPVVPRRHSWSHFDKEVSTWLLSLPKPIGILAGTDAGGQELVLICQRIGLRVPDDVALLGPENDELRCEGVRPPLSSIALPAERMGFEAAAMLDRLLSGETPPVQPLQLPPLRVISRQSTDVLFTSEPDLTAAMHYIREHAHEHIGVSDVLRHVAVNRRRLERLFRRVLGHTPHQEIRRVRIEQAKQLLTDTDLSMEAVAERCGFDSAVRFSTNFHKQASMTPSAYRRQSRLQ